MFRSEAFDRQRPNPQHHLFSQAARAQHMNNTSEEFNTSRFSAPLNQSNPNHSHTVQNNHYQPPNNNPYQNNQYPDSSVTQSSPDRQQHNIHNVNTTKTTMGAHNDVTNPFNNTRHQIPDNSYNYTLHPYPAQQ